MVGGIGGGLEPAGWGSESLGLSIVDLWWSWVLGSFASWALENLRFGFGCLRFWILECLRLWILELGILGLVFGLFL